MKSQVCLPQMLPCWYSPLNAYVSVTNSFTLLSLSGDLIWLDRHLLEEDVWKVTWPSQILPQEFLWPTRSPGLHLRQLWGGSHHYATGQGLSLSDTIPCWPCSLYPPVDCIYFFITWFPDEHFLSARVQSNFCLRLCFRKPNLRHQEFQSCKFMSILRALLPKG